MKIAIVGAGLTGLVAGYRLSQKGHLVTIYEKSADIGGLMGGFSIGKTSLEKAYHHIFTTDKYIIDLTKELGLSQKLEWYPEKTSLYFGGTVYPFMGAMDLLKFKPLTLISKFRLGVVKILLEKDNNWEKYSNVAAYHWMKKWCGEEGYRVIWEPLLKGKFHEKYKEVSMAWLWARIHTRGNSGKLGYFNGGFRIIADELARRIKENGGEIVLKAEVDPTRLLRRPNLKESPRNDDGLFDKVIYTGAAKGIDYIGAVCLVFTSKQSLSNRYWHNINDKNSPFLAFIQHTNLVDKKQYGNKNVYYMGVYVPHDHRNFTEKSEKIINEWFEYLTNVFPDFDRNSVEEKWLWKFKNAQHIVTKNYQIPSRKISEKVYQSNFAQIYPEDRGTNFAVREGERVAREIHSKSQ